MQTCRENISFKELGKEIMNFINLSFKKLEKIQEKRIVYYIQNISLKVIMRREEDMYFLNASLTVIFSGLFLYSRSARNTDA